MVKKEDDFTKVALIAGAAYALKYLQTTKRSTPKQALQHVSKSMSEILRNIYMEREDEDNVRKYEDRIKLAVIAGASHAVKFVPTHSDFDEEALIKKVSDSSSKLLRGID